MRHPPRTETGFGEQQIEVNVVLSESGMSGEKRLRAQHDPLALSGAHRAITGVQRATADLHFAHGDRSSTNDDEIKFTPDRSTPAARERSPSAY